MTPWSAEPDMIVERIVSGGQTGVDRAALDIARELGIELGGWCPRGRLAEDGPIPSYYPLQETGSTDYPVRTEQNVLSSDGTLILYRGRLQGGTQLTRKLARRHGKPYLLVDLEAPKSPLVVRHWLEDQAIKVLNVAGPRESSAPGIAAQTAAYLRAALTRIE